MSHPRRSFESAVFWIVIGILMACLLFVVNYPAKASGSCRTHKCEDTPRFVNVFFDTHDYDEHDLRRSAGWGALLTIGGACVGWPSIKAYGWPAAKGLFTLSKPKLKPWVNCWEDPTKDEPLPSPGPTPLTITPKNMKDSTYIIEAR